MTAFAPELLAWYRQNKRSLPWRDHPDPYAVWISEIMLQQTRVDTVIPYFERWMAKFPTVEVLARADEQAVLNLWEGLGYYSRARNLHRAAKLLVEEHDAQLPEDTKNLMKLPGIGRYTAAAISSMAFGHDAAALDGNIRRVYARIFNVEEALGTTQAEKIFWSLAEDYLPKGDAGDYNQALMDLGATICMPRNPLCESCPISQDCEAYQLDIQDMRPVPKVKKAVPHHVHTAAVIVEDGRVLLAQRPSKGLLGGMWEFPNGRVDGDPAEGLADVIDKGFKLNVEIMNLLVEVRHAYTHFKVTEYVFRCKLIRSSQKVNLRWVSLDELDDYPMGKIDRQIARKLSSPPENEES
ncbi:MAG: A/G-specific adenine glycosylase [Anaerolineae bacterium]|jgi:A/G-specific adenine glycosylase|nr:A/G-specific adenine glycosylase [Anaerolineae bacterium]MBT7069351.1 A/G-specific adenine glycosylase [Anaerolineae bacterium]MBT7326533.1 A/G-specific adenine glycosylase [Anaerolineae bacterium]MBT7599740.1 A/G-specific adenine glycosylase [Anaerolineae bacterium]